MTGGLRGVQGHQVDWLSTGWGVAECDAGAIDGPGGLDAAALRWVDAVVPSTAASTLRARGLWSLDGAARRFDAADWWYRTRFQAAPAASGEQLWLCFDGLATVADVWLNGEPLLTSAGMFLAHERRVDHLLRAENELVIRFRSLDALLAVRRPRGRWRVPMAEHQQLRWFRTTLLGRTPGWSPPAAAVGPWRGIRIERRRGVAVRDIQLRAAGDGVLDVGCTIEPIDSGQVTGVDVVVEREGRILTAPLAFRDSGAGRAAGRLVVPDVAQWWPHTHGEPALYAARLRIRQGSNTVDADLADIGFRSASVETGDGDFAVSVNGAPVFCRGACWTPLDPVALTADPEAEAHAVAQVVEAGMNMVRVGGTMVYESDRFLDCCDASGVMLWQDFMFANFDYPDGDADFVGVVEDEVRQVLARLQGRPSVTVLCGNSEGEQQAAMWGASRDRWAPPLFHERIAALAREACPDVAYWPSSAHGGAFPHEPRVGTTSYYGVGAYLRPLEDARRSEVRFASECLAFANIPGDHTLALVPGASAVKAHHAAWKARSPRDLGAGWDFDDVRDHYLATLFRVDPLALRYADHDRYMALSRVVTGEVMGAVFSEWRRKLSVTRGGLVWFLRDLWPGAGWGVVDSTGIPKAAWYYLRRALAPVALSFSDEGCNGLAIHLINDGASPVRGELSLTLYRNGDARVGEAAQSVDIGARSAIELNAASLFDGFSDLTHAYRFGPPMYEVAVATFRSPGGGNALARGFHFAAGLPNGREADIGLSATATLRADGAYDIDVVARRFAQSVHVELNGHAVDDNYFHLAPGETRRLRTRRLVGAALDGRTPLRGSVRALNAEQAATIVIA